MSLLEDSLAPAPSPQPPGLPSLADTPDHVPGASSVAQPSPPGDPAISVHTAPATAVAVPALPEIDNHRPNAEPAKPAEPATQPAPISRQAVPGPLVSNCEISKKRKRKLKRLELAISLKMTAERLEQRHALAVQDPQPKIQPQPVPPSCPKVSPPYPKIGSIPTEID